MPSVPCRLLPNDTIVVGAGGPLWAQTANARPAMISSWPGISSLSRTWSTTPYRIDRLAVSPPCGRHALQDRAALAASLFRWHRLGDVIKLRRRAEHGRPFVYRAARRGRAGSLARRRKPIRDTAVDVQALAEDRRRLDLPGPLQRSPDPRRMERGRHVRDQRCRVARWFFLCRVDRKHEPGSAERDILDVACCEGCPGSGWQGWRRGANWARVSGDVDNSA